MSTVRKVARNTGIIIFGDILFRAVSLFVTIFLARYLGTVGFGKYNFVFAYLAFFGIITDLGLQTILVREMSRDCSLAPKLMGNAYIIKLILTIFAIILSIITISFMPYPKDTTTYIYIAAFTLLFSSFSDFYATIFQANLKMEYNVIAKLIFKGLSAVLIFSIIFVKGTLMHIIVALVFSEMVKTSLCRLFSRKFVRPQFEIDFKLWKYLFRESLPIALTSVIGVLYFRIDIIMLSIIQGDAPVGIYSAAYKLSEPLILIPNALMISLFPIMSSLSEISEERLIRSYKFGVKYLLIITLPIAIGTTVLADKIILLIYGAKFAGSSDALQILIWAQVVTSVNSVLLYLLVSIGKQKLNTLSHILCIIVNIILNFILIPILSYNGAAIATVATKVVLFVTSFYFVSKHLQILPMHKIAIKPVISGLMMGTFVYYFMDINMFLLISLAGIIYLATLFALREFREDDINIMKKIISK